MSYSIEYARQFFKFQGNDGQTRYVPVMLFGDNNVYEPSWRGRGLDRRVRSWITPYDACVGATSEELVSFAKDLDTGDEMWKRGGKWMGHTGFIRWMQSGCDQACTVEDFVTFNNSTLTMYLDNDGGYSGRRVLEARLRTGEELREWIIEARDFMARETTKYHFGADILGEDITHPPVGAPGELFAMRCGKYGYCTGSRTYSNAEKDAMLLDADGWRNFAMNPDNSAAIHGFSGSKSFRKITNKERFLKDEGCVLKATAGQFAGMYVSKVTARRCYFATYLSSAMVYSTKASAQQASLRIDKRFSTASASQLVPLDLTQAKEEEVR